MTYLWGIPVGRFRITPRAPSLDMPPGIDLVYTRWPIRDRLVACVDGSFDGEGRVGSHTFCTFRLVPLVALEREQALQMSAAGR